MSRQADIVAVFGPLAGITACLVGAFRAQGDDVPFLEHLISNTTDGAAAVYATDLPTTDCQPTCGNRACDLGED